MEWIPMTTQSAYREAMIVQTLLPFLQLLLVVEHRKLAMRVARIVSGAEFDCSYIQRFELFEDLGKGELRQQRCKDAYSHLHGSFLNHGRNQPLATGNSARR